MQTSINVSIIINYNIYIYITFVLSIIDNNRPMATGTKTGGRTKGTVNKTTAELREKFSLLLGNNFDKLQNDIVLFEPKDRIKTILELAKFVVPTLRATDLTVESDQFVNMINLGNGISPEEIRLIQAELEKKY